ncbi:hypothetical protein [Chamaesiphon minutus]|uniref:Uncharacterized protein n=1 Tax=Chamaesiphon minutus (strain ATCC 27169 / PCC 6605) TaxID=1173020 RepID=K9UIM4_CHAP6|nr:hypothetical protein [Chamaesiphon minutus]AFY94059.1 hypothetical protein Cha6605_3027 [Chamaesiphon minutus PCC 6605]
MSTKFSISAVAIAALLAITHGSIASAEVYKTSKNQVVVTGLTAKQKYPIQGTNAKNKPVKRQDVAANTCGEALVDGAGKYKTLVVGTQKIDPTTLPVREHAKCKAKKTAAAATLKKKAGTATKTVLPTTAMPSTTVPTTTVPTTTTPAAK